MNRHLSAALSVAIISVAILSAVAMGQESANLAGGNAKGDGGTAIEFTRMHVPRGGLADVPLGDRRYVPMSIKEFDASIARLASGGNSPPTPSPPLVAVAYEATIDAGGRFVGRLSFDVGSGPLPLDLPLGGLQVTRGRARTAEGTGEAVIHGRSEGGLAMVIPMPGSYECQWIGEPPILTEDGPRFSLPLIPALRSTLLLRVPEGSRPLVAGLRSVPGEAADGWLTWSIEVGPASAVEILLVRADRDAVPLAVWSDLLVQGRQVAIDVVVEPRSPWLDGGVIVEVAGSIDVDAVTTMPQEGTTPGPPPERLSWSLTEDRARLAITLPQTMIGGRDPIRITAVAPLPEDGGALPFVRPPADRWAAAGTRIRLDDVLSVEQVAVEEALPVTEEAAARWPLPARPADENHDPGARSQPARLYIEHQGPAALTRLAVGPRRAVFEIARVTTVDIAPGVVLGRAACDIRVRRGEAFEVTAVVAPGWVIDAVESVEWPSPDTRDGPVMPGSSRAVVEPPEWSVMNDAGRSVLKIGMSVAATPARNLGLRVSGHRAGVAAGKAVSVAEIDMLRFEGEAEGLAVIAFKTNPDTAIEIEGGKAEGMPLDPRLAGMVEEGSLRAWAVAGQSAPDWEARLVRRRPPLDVLARVRVTARDDRITEAFTFECRPDTSALDSLVVHFSEPLDDRLEWSLLPPARGTLTARRLEEGESPRGRGRAAAEAAESWLVEITPPMGEGVVIRAVRSRPFQVATPVTLAWVDGAVRQIGELTIQAAGRGRPQVVNRRLAELPPLLRDDESVSSLVANFSFSAETAGGSPAVELVPAARAAGSEPRAWAWSETTTSWCHAAGQTESETVFEIENHGRSDITLHLPTGRVVEEVFVNGLRQPREGRAATPSLGVELPAGSRFVRVLVRTVAASRPGRAWWWVDQPSVAIDLPVFDRLWRVLVPDGLRLVPTTATGRPVDPVASGWSERLLGASRRRPLAPSVSATSAGSIEDGFRPQTFLASAVGDGGVTIVRSSVLVTAGTLAAILIMLVAFGLCGRRPWLPLCICVTAALLCLWAPEPFELIVRPAWWAALLAVCLLRWKVAIPGATSPLLLIACGLASADIQAAEPGGPDAGRSRPLPVFVTPGDSGAMALVPEELFRILARGDDGVSSSSARVVACEVAVPAARAAGPTAWRMSIDVEADPGAVLLLDQSSTGGRFVAATARLDGEAIVARSGNQSRIVWLPMVNAGRHRVEIDVEPATTRLGDVEYATAAIAVAPTGALIVAGGAETGLPTSAVECDAGGPTGPFVPAARMTDSDGLPRFDVARAATVRVVRAADPRTRLTQRVGRAESRNDVFWDLDACRVNAMFEIDPGDDLLRSVVVAVDPRLEQSAPDANTAGFVCRKLAADRYRVERSVPVRGPFRFELQFRMPLTDPVGTFTLPHVWLERAEADRRMSRLMPSPSLSVEVSLPDGVVPLPPRGGDAALQTHAWLAESVDAAAADDQTGRGRSLSTAGVRLLSERRRQRTPGTQSVRIAFEPRQTRLRLRARIDASSTALLSVPVALPADAVVDRLEIFEDEVQPLDPVDRGSIDLRWTRESADRVVAILQRPRAGRFRLEMTAHLPAAPARKAPLPLLRAILDDTVPMVVSWNARPGQLSADRSIEVFPDQPAPDYALEEPRDEDTPTATGDASPVPNAASTTADAAAPRPRVELADIQLTIDDRGRAWGTARFELLAAGPVVSLRLPPGMRLFEVFVDGRIADASLPNLPAAGTVWDVRLHDVRWPRSLVAVFAGDLGRRLADGMPIQIEPPRLVGLPCSRLLWTLIPPPGLMIRVAEPAEVVAAGLLEAEREAAIGRLDEDFQRAIATAPPAERPRLQDFQRSRPALASRRPQPEASDRLPGAVTAPAAGTLPTHVIMDEDVGLAIRASRRQDGTVSGRGLATLLTLSVGGVALVLARWQPRGFVSLIRLLLPIAAMLGGGVWTVTLLPWWPGVAIWLGGCAALVAAWPRRGGEGLPGKTSGADGALAAGDATTSFAKGLAVAGQGSSITQVAHAAPPEPAE
jgi:hypothetical protein